MNVKKAAANLELLHVRHATFQELSNAGYPVEIIDDGSVPLEMDESVLHGMPGNWKQPEPVILPKYVTLKGAVLFHDGSALLPDGYYCNFDPGFNLEPWRERYEPRGRSVMQYIHPRYNDALIERHAKINTISGRCFAALHNFCNNYGHFVHDVLPRIYYEDLGVIAPGREKIIAPHYSFPMQKALFEKVYSDYEIINLPNKFALEVEELVLPANLCSSSQFNPAPLAALAKRMSKIMAHYSEKHSHKICISRRDSPLNNLGRNFANTEEFETRMENMGYKIVEASKLAPNSQFAIFCNTASMVGIHGAGLMNFIMMTPGRDFTEIAGAPHGRARIINSPKYIARSAMAFGHQVDVIASRLGPDNLQEIDVEQVELVLGSGSP